MALVIGRKRDEEGLVIIDSNGLEINIRITTSDREDLRLSVEAPKEIKIYREEFYYGQMDVATE